MKLIGTVVLLRYVHRRQDGFEFLEREAELAAPPASREGGGAGGEGRGDEASA